MRIFTFTACLSPVLSTLLQHPEQCSPMDSESNAGENTESSLTALHLESEGSAGLLWEGHAISGDVEAASEIDAAEAAEASAAADGKSSKKRKKKERDQEPPKPQRSTSGRAGCKCR